MLAAAAPAIIELCGKECGTTSAGKCGLLPPYCACWTHVLLLLPPRVTGWLGGGGRCAAAAPTLCGGGTHCGQLLTTAAGGGRFLPGAAEKDVRVWWCSVVRRAKKINTGNQIGEESEFSTRISSFLQKKCWFDNYSKLAVSSKILNKK